MDQIREEFVLKYASFSKPYVILNDQVLDLSDFMDRHPGGSAVLLANLGRDVTADFWHVPAHALHGALRRVDKLAVAAVDRTAAPTRSDVGRLLDYLRLVLNSFLVIQDPRRDPLADVVYVGQVYCQVVGDHLPAFLQMISELAPPDVETLTPGRLERINEITLSRVEKILESTDRSAAAALSRQMREHCAELVNHLLAVVVDAAVMSLAAGDETGFPTGLEKALLAAQEWTREEHELAVAG